jgi:DNA polymerase-3 subunit epsilon
VSLLARWLRRKPDSDLSVAARREWGALSPPSPRLSWQTLRFVAVDTETSGLDPARDQLISIGACAIEAGAIRIGECFAALLRQDNPSTEANVLIHGIGHGAQAAGQPPAEALAAYLGFARRDTFVGYHAPFDLLLVQRAVRDALGIAYRPAWLDLALLLPALEGQPDAAQWDLDRWLARFRLRAYARHDALADAAATAELFLIALHKASARGLRTLGELLKLQKQQAKLVRMGHT